MINYGTHIHSVALKNFSSEHHDFLETTNENNLTRIGYKRYFIDNSYKYRILLVEAHIKKNINPKYLKFLNTYDKYQILKQQIYTVLNLAPCDFITFIDKDPFVKFDFF